MSQNQGRSRRPQDTDFKQQRLKAWQPILTPKYVIGSFCCLGIFFIPIGIAILAASNKVVEFKVRYDHLPRCKIDLESNNFGRICSVDIKIDKDMDAPIYFYYELKNFYQNHRRYVKSRSDTQLRGQDDPSTSDCDPLEKVDGKTLYPCGLIAASFFSDRFYATYTNPLADGAVSRNFSNTGFETPFSDREAGNDWEKKGIAWSSDVNAKFKKPDDGFLFDSDPALFKEKFTQQGPEQLITNQTLPPWNDEDFIVWMRTAGLPTFKKLHRIIKDTDLKSGGTLTINIQNFFRVGDFDGEKSVVLSTTSWLGGKNNFLGLAYIIVGSLCVLLAAIFLTKHKVSPRKLGDMNYFKWNTRTSGR